MGSSSVLTPSNQGTSFDQSWIDLAPESAAFEAGKEVVVSREEDIRLIVSLLDLTSLNEDDTPQDILDLLANAIAPLPGESVSVAGVCVYPQHLFLAGTWLHERGIRLATVAGDFPYGQAPLVDRTKEVSHAARLADEVDFPIDRRFALNGKWEHLYFEIKELVSAAHGVPTKVILGTGELADSQMIYSAAIVAMMAGATFVKTSTGKEKINATLEAGYAMCQAIKDYERWTGYRVGIKPAGGIRTTSEALKWLQLIRTQLSEEWITPELFRIGASSLLDDLRSKAALLAGDKSA